MRKVEKDMVIALRDGKAMTARNTMVTAPDSDNVQRVYLHGHEIATYYRETRTCTVRMCGWPSVTTRSRLNALSVSGGTAGFYQRHGVQYIEPGIEFDATHGEHTANKVNFDLPSWVRA